MGEPILDPGRQAGMCVYDGAEWQKAKGDTDGHQQVDVVSAPTTTVIPASGERLVGFSGIVEEAISNLDLAAGVNVLSGTVVPTGKIWKITCAGIRYEGTAPNRIRLYANGLASALYLIEEISPTVKKWYVWNGEIYLQAGDNMEADVLGATSGDNYHLRYAGLEMSAP